MCRYYAQDPKNAGAYLYIVLPKVSKGRAFVARGITPVFFPCHATACGAVVGTSPSNDALIRKYTDRQIAVQILEDMVHCISEGRPNDAAAKFEELNEGPQLRRALKHVTIEPFWGGVFDDEPDEAYWYMEYDGE